MIYALPAMVVVSVILVIVMFARILRRAAGKRPPRSFRRAPADTATVRLGETPVVVRRMTLAEIRKAKLMFFSGKDEFGDQAERIIADHVSYPDGKAIDAGTLSRPQLDELLKEIFGNPEGSGISDFIWLLS